jgi:capsular polysaccharide biosynthesis protein
MIIAEAEPSDELDSQLTPSAPRLDLQAIASPDLVPGGRLRLLDYPPHDQSQLEIKTLPIKFVSRRKVTATTLESKGLAKVVGAVYNRNGTIIRDTQRAKAGKAWHSNPSTLAPSVAASATRELAGRSFFLGHYSPGFGHVLLETLTRLWPAVDYGKYDNFVLYPRRLDATPVIQRKKWLDGLLEPFGVSMDKAVLVQETMRIARLDIASAPFVIKTAADPRFLRVFDVISQHVEKTAGRPAVSSTPPRVYLSRSGLGSKRHADNESSIERLMTSRGFVVVRPEAMSIAEQVGLLKGAEVVAGCDGSGLHMAVFMRPGTKLLAIDSRIVPSQFLIDQARGLDAVHVLAVDGVIARLETWTAALDRVNFALDLLLGES